MLDSQFGIYFYGSVAQKRSAVFSDIDLIILFTNEWTTQDEIEVKGRLFQKFPTWKNKKLDVLFIKVPNFYPKRQADMVALGWLQKNPQKPILGTDLLSQAYRPTWDDYLAAQKRIVDNWFEKTNDIDRKVLFEKCVDLGNTKHLYSICFSIALYLALINQPGTWVFRYDELREPLVKEARELLRNQWLFKMPKAETDLFKLKALCLKIHLLSLQVIEKENSSSHFKT